MEQSRVHVDVNLENVNKEMNTGHIIADVTVDGKNITYTVKNFNSHEVTDWADKEKTYRKPQTKVDLDSPKNKEEILKAVKVEHAVEYPKILQRQKEAESA